MYKLTNSTSIQRLSDGASIPADEGNTDYAAYCDWMAAGNTPEPADVPPPPTPIQQIRALEQAHDDDQRKLNRQGAIDTALTIACRNPAAAAMTRDQVHAAYYAGNRGYRAMVDLEAQCAALRKLIV